MGPDYLDQLDKPRKNPWIEKKIEEGVFGGEGAGIEAIAAGGMHTMFVDEKGTIWSCGVNDEAALGRITKDVPDPEKEGEFMDVDVLTAFPYPLESLVEEKFRAVKIAAGDNICAAISDQGELRVWGSFRANEGSLGFSSGLKLQHLPTPILNLPKDEKVASVAAGDNHLVVLTTYGNIYTWGAGEQGQLGRKILERRKIHGTTPEKVTLRLRSRKAVTVGAGNFASFAVDEKGDVWGWGLNSVGQVGTGYEDEDDGIVPQPRLIEELSPAALGNDARVTRIVGGDHHTIFLTSDGRVFGCGRASGGRLGLPSTHPAFTVKGYNGFVAKPTHIPFPDPASEDPVVHVSAGPRANFAVTAAGAMYAWGEGNQGELGIGEGRNAETPTVVVRKEGGSWKAIAAECGGQHGLGLFRKKVAANTG
ncbi:RCC1/BLIP-II [Fomitiporia mediterranea MF3/22]|uniref:RCC1/BLIP-II n=1 Tax=Fomitiporia mediterranea (strain MF3/22) TaxID=694068 RepID=UPI0004407757|nr:RCC1/BLIP-II [Fomitiporia mediterranea MF3/22]EJD01011.1 RCC1/BLIP-II [Fomitiporia mediterranea MF3/22]